MERLQKFSQPYTGVDSVLHFIDELGIDITKDETILTKAINSIFYHSKNN